MSTIDRNGLCPCGSGKKYKKCCLNVHQGNKSNQIVSARNDGICSLSQSDHLNNEELVLLSTATNEPFMLARLYYDVYEKSELIKQLSKLRCIDWDENNKFFLNYIYETKDIDLAVKCNKVPNELQPIILAEGKIIEEATMVLDLRSFERAWCIIEFLDQYIPRDVAKITHIATYNKMHKVTVKTASDMMHTNYDQLFSEENIYRPEVRVEKFMADTKKVDSMEEKQKLLMDFVGEAAADKPRLIEKFPAHFYEDGIDSVKSKLKLKQSLAYEHLNGNTSLNMFQLISKMTKK
ncbi:MAG TPA: SEC-C domain-containing protein [Chthoniobacterales bacterium]|nr:SEC-C domain-containing protein [Chthoniobacterales bacterium]